MINKKLYNILERIFGYVVLPLSLAGIGLPLYLKLPVSYKTLIGCIFLIISILVILYNLNIISRRIINEKGASHIPACFAFSAIPAVWLLDSGNLTRDIAMTIIIVIIDLIGQPLIGFGIAKIITVLSHFFYIG